jgi:hypothetical protein
MSTLFGLNAQPDFSHPFFSNVTHLEFTDLWEIWVDQLEGLRELPRLTHLALDFAGIPNDGLELIDTLQAVLKSCKMLQILLLLIQEVDSDHLVDAIDYDSFPGINDPRFVLDVDDCLGWEAFMFGEDDMWTAAEGASEGRKYSSKAFS